MGWVTRPLSECVSALIDYRGRSPAKTKEGVPLITAKIVKDGRILTPREYVANEDYDTWMRRGIPHPGDVVVTTEAPLGEVAQLGATKVALAQRLITLRGKKGILDNGFLKYAMLSSFVQDQLKARSSGTTVLGIRQTELRKISLPLPPILEQESISRILGCLDRKIALNQGMNEFLEEIFRALFRSWFVDFDPVRDKAKGKWKKGMSLLGIPSDLWDFWPSELEKSEIGEIPKGWFVRTLGNVAELANQLVNPDSVDPSLPYVGLEHFEPRHLTIYRPGKMAEVKTAKLRFKAGDFLFGRLRPYFHKVAVTCEDGYASTTAAVVRPSAPTWYAFVLGHLDSDAFIDYAAANSNGTTMPTVSGRDMLDYKIAMPSGQVLAERCNGAVLPLIERIRANAMECQTLSAARDTLLPKLLSGEVRVPQHGKLGGAA